MSKQRRGSVHTDHELHTKPISKTGRATGPDPLNLGRFIAKKVQWLHLKLKVWSGMNFSQVELSECGCVHYEPLIDGIIYATAIKLKGSLHNWVRNAQIRWKPTRKPPLKKGPLTLTWAKRACIGRHKITVVCSVYLIPNLYPDWSRIIETFKEGTEGPLNWRVKPPARAVFKKLFIPRRGPV
jgi:hypothetical protein